MLKVPERYLETIISNVGIEKDISLITAYFISKSSNNLHFITDEKELKLVDIICKISQNMNACTNTDFIFHEGQKVINLRRHQDGIFSILSLNPITLLKENDATKHTKLPPTLDEFIPITNSAIQQVGTIKNRIGEFRELFGAKNQSDFFSKEKLLVIGNLNLFNHT